MAPTSEESTLGASQSVLHIAYLPASAGWLLPIIGRLQRSEHATLRVRVANWPGSELGERGLVLSTKLAMLGPVLKQFDTLLEQLHTEIVALDDLDGYLKRGAGFIPSDRELPFEVLVALDAFVFEYRSTYEILGGFLRCFGEQILGRAYTEVHLQRVLRAAGLDLAWSDQLSALRKRLFHESAPWLGIRLLARFPLRWELLVLDSSTHARHATTPAIEFAAIRAIHTGMSGALARLHEWLLEEIDSFEATTSA